MIVGFQVGCGGLKLSLVRERFGSAGSSGEGVYLMGGGIEEERSRCQ